jgi:hypothetical protein
MTKKLGILAIAATAAAALALHGHAAFAAGGQLFKANLTGTAAFTSQTTTAFTGSGRATLMGHVTSVGTAVITGPDSSCPGGVANVNTETLTNNDGDTLTITSQDVACPEGPGMYHGTGQWTVTGATGQFNGATGQGSFDGHSDFNAGTFTLTLTGVLGLPHQE